MYTFDLSLITTNFAKGDNFYFRLNVALRRRDPSFLREGQAYMYYLMHGLESLPAFKFSGKEGNYLWRGVNSNGRDRVVQEYSLMRQVQIHRLQEICDLSCLENINGVLCTTHVCFPLEQSALHIICTNRSHQSLGKAPASYWVLVEFNSNSTYIVLNIFAHVDD